MGGKRALESSDSECEDTAPCEDIPPTKKQRTIKRALKASRTNVVRAWVLGTTTLKTQLFYHDSCWHIDVINEEKPNTVLTLNRDVLATLNCVKDMVSEGEFSYHLGDNVYLKRNLFRSKWYLSVRLYYSGEDGSLQPGRQGVTMTETAWCALKSSLGSIGMYITP